MTAVPSLYLFNDTLQVLQEQKSQLPHRFAWPTLRTTRVTLITEGRRVEDWGPGPANTCKLRDTYLMRKGTTSIINAGYIKWKMGQIGTKSSQKQFSIKYT